MQDARPQQSLCYEINIKITGSDTSTPKKYSWVEVYRDSNGIWNELKRVGNATLDPAYEVNNAAVVSGMICLARRDQRTGSLLFVTRSSSASAPSSPSCPINLLATFEFYGTGEYCSSNWVWAGGKDAEGNLIPVPIPCSAAWGIGHINQGKFGLASFDYIEFQYMKLHQSTWSTAKRLIPGTDPDPRITPYKWIPPVYPVRIRVIAKLAKVAYYNQSDFQYTPQPAAFVYANTVSDLQTPDTMPDGKPNEIWIYSTDVGSTRTLAAKTDLMQPDHSTTAPVASVTLAISNPQFTGNAIGSPNVTPSSAVISTKNSVHGTVVCNHEPCSGFGGYWYGSIGYYSTPQTFDSISGSTHFNSTVSGNSFVGPRYYHGFDISGVRPGASIYRTRWGINPDSYGVGNYIDLRYYGLLFNGAISAWADGTPGSDDFVSGGGGTQYSWGTYNPTVEPPPGTLGTNSSIISERKMFGNNLITLFNFPMSFDYSITIA
jgi:hypothetical protein